MTLPILLAVIVTNIAPDGVNTIITDTETGCSQSTCAYVWPRACADINVGVVPDEFLQGSPQTVLIPGADQSYVVMSEEWYADLTNRLASTERVVYVVRSDYEKTEEGRVKIHGKRVRYSVDAENLTHTAFYEDGWHITESFAPRKSNTPTGSAASAPSVGADHRAARNPRYAAALKRREAAKKARRKDRHPHGRCPMKRYLKDTLPILIAMALLIAFAVFDFLKCYAAAPVPMERLLRNGLTDSQVTAILATDPNATIHINGSTWRNIAFNTARYNNVTNWLSVIGETNDFARLVVPLSQTNAVLTAENAALTRQVETISAELSHLRDHEIVFLQETATTLRSLSAKYPRMATELNSVIASINQRIEELGGEPVSTDGGSGSETMSDVD